MFRGLTLLTIAIVLWAPCRVSTAVDCAAALAGKWASKGEFDMGRKVRVDNLFVLRPDGSFETSQKYLDEGGKWQENKAAGKWSAKPGKGPNECEVILSTSSDAGSSSSTTTVVIIDNDTYRIWGMDAKRVE